MANVIINDTHLINIADAIREKTGTSDTYKPGEMATAIAAIEAGGGGDLPEEAFKITGDCSYRFYDGNWDWFIEKYGDKITTENINSAGSMFYYSKLERIPFDINLDSSRKGLSLVSMFYNSNLKELPKLNAQITKIPTSQYDFLQIKEIFSYTHYLREIPDDYLTSIVPEGYWQKRPGNGIANACSGCYSLRKQINLIPFIQQSGTRSYNSAYDGLYYTCYALDEVINLPVETGPTYTGNAFSSTFGKCYRLKNITFATQEDGIPYTANWKSQTIDLVSYIGYGDSSYRSDITRYNSGITLDKEVKDDATYQALKNDPDWFTCNIKYSRYNHDSAVATINSLPDTSAYLAANSGTNTIKFYGVAGELTDGGAINTLTDAEIAVATAKGWTVSLA